jgi:transposase InsO family protein
MVYKQYVQCCDELRVIGQLVLRGTRVVIPKKLRPRVLSLAHQAHLGIVGTKQQLRSKVWWPGMEKDVEKYCKACHGCQLVSRPDYVEPVQTTSLPSGPWRDLAINLLKPLPTGESILIVIDYYSHYYEIDVMKSTVTSKIIESLETIFSRHGLPEALTSDNGPQFISTEFKGYMENQGILHRKITAKCPQANGEVERQNPSLLKIIQIAHTEKKDWKKELNTYLTSYRSLLQLPVSAQQSYYLGERCEHNCQNLRTYMLSMKCEIEIMSESKRYADET